MSVDLKDTGEKIANTAKGVGRETARIAKETGQTVGTAAVKAAVKVKEGVMGFGNTISEKTKELAQEGKLMSIKSEKQKMLDRAYYHLGEIVYREGGLTGEAAEKSEEIKKLYNELQEIETQLNTISSGQQK